MRLVLQRVSRAAVSVDGSVVGAVGTANPGSQALFVLVGVTHEDGAEQVEWCARKIADLRILDGERSVLEAGAPVLVVSQFTLYGEARKGRRPSWTAAAPGPVAEPLVDALVAALRGRGITVATGRFGAEMTVELTATGPMTVILDSPSA